MLALVIFKWSHLGVGTRRSPPIRQIDSETVHTTVLCNSTPPLTPHLLPPLAPSYREKHPDKPLLPNDSARAPVEDVSEDAARGVTKELRCGIRKRITRQILAVNRLLGALKYMHSHCGSICHIWFPNEPLWFRTPTGTAGGPLFWGLWYTSPKRRTLNLL